MYVSVTLCVCVGLARSSMYVCVFVSVCVSDTVWSWQGLLCMSVCLLVCVSVTLCGAGTVFYVCLCVC